MKWSYKIGRLAGIPLRIHITFPLIVPLIVSQQAEAIAQQQGISVSAALPQALFLGLGFVVIAFSSVVLHELGHALVARRYGIQTRDINLLPIGGVAMLERMPSKPTQEIAIAAAGPAVSFALAGLTLPLWFLLDGTFAGDAFRLAALVNLALGVFNLVPALPMDGGRVLRGGLALWKGRAAATQIAATVAKAIAAVFIVVGIFGNWSLALIGLFVYLGASSEGAHERIRRDLSGLTAANVMVTDFRVLTPETQIGYAAQIAARTMQNDFPVVRDGFVIGMVTRRRLLAAMAERRDGEPAAWHMDRVPRFATPDTPLFELASDSRVRHMSVPVLAGGRLVGLLIPERLHSPGPVPPGSGQPGGPFVHRA